VKIGIGGLLIDEKGDWVDEKAGFSNKKRLFFSDQAFYNN